MVVVDPAGAATRALTTTAVQRCWVEAWQDAQPLEASQQVGRGAARIAVCR